MTLTASVPHDYDDPNVTLIRSVSLHDLGGVADTVYGIQRFWEKSVVSAIYAVVAVTDEITGDPDVPATGATWQAYYSPVESPDGSDDVALGDPWAVADSAAGVTQTILLDGLTASGALEVDEWGRPIFNPGDFIYLKTGEDNGDTGRIDVGYEFRWHPDAESN